MVKIIKETDSKETDSFEKLGLSETTLKALKKKGFEEPTGIQKKIIPLLLKGDKDIIGQAQTGTGKTAAFGLPILEKIQPGGKDIKAIILTPTRELAIQVSEELNSLKGDRGIKIIPVYGGQAISQQISKLRSNVDIVVGTPGRVIDHIKRKTMKLSKISYIVLDEADEMLNMGFIDEVEEILEAVSDDRKMLLFSATMPDRIKKIGEKYMSEYEHIISEKEQLVTGLTEQIYFEVSERDKFEALCRIIDIEEDFYGLIFCRTKVGVDDVASRLSGRGYDSAALHGDITQAQREIILNKFRKKNVTILVATDVAARGIDIMNLSHVINYSLPQDPESYVHRIGRTGRAGNEGVAITFVTPDEYRKLTFIQRVAKTEIVKMQIPGVEDVIQAKKERIMSDIENIDPEEISDDFIKMAEELFIKSSHENILAAVLLSAFRDDLDRNSYREIRKVSIDKQGKARLFIQMGRKDELSKRKLAEMIEKKSGVNERFLRDIQVYDAFSFVTTSYNDADRIIKAFKSMKRGRRPMIELAKTEKKRSRR